MNEKKQNQAVLLDNLVYLTCKIEEEDAVTHEIKKVLVDPTKFDNVGQYVQKLIDDGEEGCLIKDEDGTERYPGSIEWKEWKEVLNAIKADKELSSMKISECYDSVIFHYICQFKKGLSKNVKSCQIYVYQGFQKLAKKSLPSMLKMKNGEDGRICLWISRFSFFVFHEKFWSFIISKSVS